MTNFPQLLTTAGLKQGLFGISLLIIAGCASPGNERPVAQGMVHGANQHGVGEKCSVSTNPLSVHCGRTPTTAFDNNGRLWAAYVVGSHTYVSFSDDLGRSFSTPVRVNQQPEKIYTNGENRAKIAFGHDGEIFVSWTKETPGPFHGDIRFSRSLDGGRSFEEVRTVNDDGLLTSHRFDAMLVNSDGDIFITWLDKRDQVAAQARGERYTGAALYYSVSQDNGASFARNLKVADYSCECCRIAMAETPEGDVAVFWRHIFGDRLHIRDHGFAVIGRNNVVTDLQWATRDHWELEGCPHHGPSMISAGDGRYHITWFTLGNERKGIFYGLYNPDTRETGNLATMSTTASSHPYIARITGKLMLVWKQFDGEKTNIRLAVSDDDGENWQPEITIASTRGASDHPLLVTHHEAGWLSWHTGEEGLRMVSLNHIYMGHGQGVSTQ